MGTGFISVACRDIQMLDRDSYRLKEKFDTPNVGAFLHCD